jgi:hypothetical protein
MQVGIIGYSPGNGHPFSFAAISNGYNAESFIQAGWSIILDYLKAQPQEAFGFNGAKITHAWTQDPKLTKLLCTASNIAHAVTDAREMIGQVDAVIIARDDYASHYSLAQPFLKHGIPIFIDKPLTLNTTELDFFMPYLEQGLLMSTSGMRYAKELDTLRENHHLLENLHLIEGTILFNLEKYGIHLLDAINGLNIGQPIAITKLSGSFESYRLELEHNIQFNLSCLGKVPKLLKLCFYTADNHYDIHLNDNFSAFKRTLTNFFTMVSTKKPIIDPQETINTMHLIKAAKLLKPYETVKLKIL